MVVIKEWMTITFQEPGYANQEKIENTFGLCCVYDYAYHCIVRGGDLSRSDGDEREFTDAMRPVVSINLDTLGLKLEKVSRRYLRANR